MAIWGRKPNDCFHIFREHVSKLVSAVVPTDCPMLIEGRDERRTLTFKNAAHDDAVPLKTRENGTIYLYMAQRLLTEHDKGRKEHRLRTVGYEYKLFAMSPAVDDDSLIRWEYKAQARAHVGECRHHMQVGRIDARQLPLNQGSMDLARVHLPTGWVLMEHVFRFLIHELGVKPPCGDKWADVLQKSEDDFFGGFTDKGGQGVGSP